MASIKQQLITAKNADNNLQLLVFGYIKLIQKSNESLNIIPTEIIYLCILFLFQKEFFEIIPNKIILSDDKLTVTKQALADEGWLNTSYGKVVVSSISQTIVTWKLKINQSKYSGNFCIGIASNAKCVNDDIVFDEDSYIYIFGANGCRLNNDLDTPIIVDYTDAADRFRYDSGDIVTIKVNFKDASISFGANDKLAVAFKKIAMNADISYRLAVSIRNPSDSVSIVDFVERA